VKPHIFHPEAWEEYVLFNITLMSDQNCERGSIKKSSG